LLVGLALGGCSLAPRYQRPALPVADAFPGAAAAASPAPQPGWRGLFGDPRLRALLDLALERNRDLRIAALNVEQTRAQYRIQRSAFLPGVGAAAAVTRQRVPADLSTTGRAVTADAWSVGLGVTAFELDLFGRVRSLSDAALEQYLATEEAQRAARIALVAGVATQYLSLRALEEQVAVARSTLEAVEASFRLTSRSAEAGRGSELDLRTAETQVEAARFNLAAAEQQRMRAENGLLLLVGGALPADLPGGAPLDAAQVVTDLPVGLPSEVLLRRPDVLAAEHALQSANALVGAARAAFFPSITLVGTGGVASARLEGLFGAGSEAWSFTPRVTVPLFAGGALRASLDVAKLRTSAEVARYERTVQGAFREVADALGSRAWLDEQLRALEARVAAEERRHQLSERRYRAGIDPYLLLLTAERDLYGARQLLIQARLARLANLVDLYRALGGGWSAADPA
jgi:multidrug efflux system outer membrane protein